MFFFRHLFPDGNPEQNPLSIGEPAHCILSPFFLHKEYSNPKFNAIFFNNITGGNCNHAAVPTFLETNYLEIELIHISRISIRVDVLSSCGDERGAGYLLRPPPPILGTGIYMHR